MRYRAFLSYSHADEQWARWLLRSLESYRVPASLVGTRGRHGPIPAKLGQVFRDRDELPSAGNLSGVINQALQDSQCLVVICSPVSAQSRWVNAEIQAFRARHGDERIFSFVVAGDPASRMLDTGSFPPALIEPEYAGGPEREPLAADARKQGDGRERALLKLIAGMLGVGLDDLARREAQQRQRRMAVVTMASILGMAITSGLAVTAYIARNDAERRQTQAEDILGFMLGDLRKNLSKVGRLELMRSVDDKATEYFATLDPRDLSDRTLEEQARSLTGIGEVRINEGNHKEAMAAFREAHARSTALYQRTPGNGQRLFDLAQAQYWIGFVALQQGHFDEARTWFEKYRDSGIQLAAMDRNNFAWQKEMTYGYHNMAALDERQGRYASAAKGMQKLYDLYTKWVTEKPQDLQLRMDFADKISWLGSINMRQGRLREAHRYFTELNKVYDHILEQNPRNATSKKLSLDARQLLVDIQILLGKFDEARKTNTHAMQMAENLFDFDPKNNLARLALGVARFRQSELSSTTDPAVYEEALTTLNAAHNIEPENEIITLWLVRALMAKGRAYALHGNLNASFVAAAEANRLIAKFPGKNPSEGIRISKAMLLIYEGEMQLRSGNAERANTLLDDAQALLKMEPKANTPFSRLYPLVTGLYLQGKSVEAAEYRSRLDQAGFVPPRPYR